MLEKQDLFEARTRGYHTCRIPGIAVTRNSVVLVTAEARPGRGGDYDYNDILMRRSDDGGKTFVSPLKLVDHTTFGDGPVSNFVMIPDQVSGRVVAVFCHDYARAFAMTSDDDGASFSTPVEITTVFEQFRVDYPWKVCATGPGHGLQLRNGRMIVPVWLSDGGGTEMGKHRGHRPSVVTLIYSDDHGQTWQRGDIVCRHGDSVNGITVINPSETIAVELCDGQVMLSIRSESEIHRRLIVVSPDGVSGWGTARFDEGLLEPVCMAGFLRHAWPEGDEPGRLLFANPDTVERSMMTAWGPIRPPNCDRKQLTVKLSRDDGLTWAAAKVLEPGPAGYSDLATLSDGTVLCIYECDTVTGMFDDRYLRLARFDLAWLVAERDPVEGCAMDCRA